MEESCIYFCLLLVKDVWNLIHPFKEILSQHGHSKKIIYLRRNTALEEVRDRGHKNISKWDFLKHFTGCFWYNLPIIMFSYMTDALMEIFCLLFVNITRFPAPSELVALNRTSDQYSLDIVLLSYCKEVFSLRLKLLLVFMDAVLFGFGFVFFNFFTSPVIPHSKVQHNTYVRETLPIPFS